ncbi:MAG: hypothetical protein DRQ40_06330 [Gammaproteobacteria bacterium]|nr:MAG: hypothetical protein DRQ40_06330 [Gammaproteobacteria bacterium]
MGSPHHGVIESVACKLLPHDKDEGVYHVETIPFQCLHLVKAIKYKIQDRVDHIAFEKQVLKDLMWKRLGR